MKQVTMVLGSRKKISHTCEFQTNVFDNYPMSKTKLMWMKLIVVHDHNPKVTLYASSSSALEFEKKRQIMSDWWYVIHPFSLLRAIWEAIMLIIYFLEEVEAPFFMTWETNMLFPYSSDCLKFMCVLNIIITFFTGYVDEIKQEIVLNQKQIAKRYLSHGFFFELIAAFPWVTLFVHAVLTKETLSENKALYLLSFTTFFTLWYIKLLLDYSKNIMGYFHATMRSYNIYRLVLLSLFLFHWLTCMQCNEFPPLWEQGISNLTKSRTDDELTVVQEYCNCFFRATSLVTKLGYGLHFSYLASDIVMDVVCILCGVVFFFFCLEQIILIDTTRTSPETKYKIQLRLLDEFMRNREMPKHMQSRLRLYYEYRFQKKFFRESVILSTLSLRLRQEILMHTCRRLVQESMLFRDAPRAVIAAIINHLKHDIFLPNEVVIKAGSYGDCMFFLSSGTVAVISRTGKEIAHMHDGSFFGELALVMEDERRVTSVMTIEFCEVYRLERDDFKYIIRPHRHLYHMIRRMALERLRQTLATENAYKNLTFYERQKDTIAHARMAQEY